MTVNLQNRSRAAQDLRDAADVLERDGWCQGCHHRDGKHCAAGAIEVAIGIDRAASTEDFARLDDACDRLAEHVGDLATRWNDAAGRTAKEVVTAMRAAADKLEQESTR